MTDGRPHSPAASTSPTPPRRRTFNINTLIAALALVAIAAHLVLRYATDARPGVADAPLLFTLATGGVYLVVVLARDLFRGQFGSDLLAGIAILTAVALDEYLAGTLVVLMLSGGEALEAYAVRSASSVLRALASRMPSVAHVVRDGKVEVVALDQINVGDTLVVLAHEVCPADGLVLDGHSTMDESYLTGEPYHIAKAPGSEVISGAVNGQAPLTIRVLRKPEDSRYARIMQVMRDSEQRRPRLRRLGDTLGALYTPLAVGIAIVAAVVAGDPVRFLAVLVVATPCPLLIGIPVAIIGSISLAARRGIIVKDPAVLEQLTTCQTIFFDKTGTLTYGEPRLADIHVVPPFTERQVIELAASLEQYSKHPLATALVEAARSRGIAIQEATSVSEPPGRGLSGQVLGKSIEITGRQHVSETVAAQLPDVQAGPECVLLVDGAYAATFRFRDQPREDVLPFIQHLGPRHKIPNLIMITGDRRSEAQRLAERVGIRTVHAQQSPEEKLEIVRRETARRRTAYLGDGINDAPALVAATVGIAFGKRSDVTSEAASAVILDSSLAKVDEFLHISGRLRRIALQTALGGMGLSLVAIGFAAAGYLPPVAGALTQEVIDVFAILNALRAARPPRRMTDM